MKSLSAILLFAVLLISQSSFGGDYLSSVYRIKDVGDTSQLGHCTGFLDEKGKRFLTAGHCFHRKGFVVIDDEGNEILQLALDRILMMASRIGLLDIAGAELTDEEVAILKNTFPLHADQYRDYQIFGYPEFRRDKPLTKINCSEVVTPLFREKMERSMGIVNLSCVAFDEEGNEINELTYEMVRGASGSPVFYGQELIGVAFHFMNERDVGQNVLKLIKLSEITQMLPYETAWQRFNLRRTIFEEAKLPNRVRSSINMRLAMNPNLRGIQFQDILDMVKMENGMWNMITTGGQEVELNPRDFSSTVSKMMDAAENKLAIEKHSLAWPLNMANWQNKLGNTMAQFQQYYYGYSYFHGGCDLVSEAGQNVTTPVAGRVEAGFYGYIQIKDGYFKKLWIPWGEHVGRDDARDSYFEVAVINADGYRFEFHHIDPNNLPEGLIAKVEAGGSVEAGEVIGVVKSFHSEVKDLPYDHIHYNIIDPKGERVNCEHVSELLADNHAPVINEVYGIHPETGRAHPLTAGQRLYFRPIEIIVKAKDQKNDQLYLHQVPLLELKFEGQRASLWDFRQRLLLPNLVRPVLFDLYAERIQTANGETFYTRGDYDHFDFFHRFSLSDEQRGSFTITAEDVKGNKTEFRAFIP